MNKQMSRFLFIVFSVLIVAISATTSFAFFYDYLGEIVPPVIGELSRAIVAGLIGVVVFDGGALVWLYNRLNVAENEEQRTIAFWLSLFDFGASSVASFAQLVLSGGKLIQLSDSDRFAIGTIAVLISSFAIILNFGGFWLFSQMGEIAKQSRREGERRDRIIKANDKFSQTLDNAIVEKTLSKLEAKADMMAESKADEVVAKRLNDEMGLVANGGKTPPQVVANSQPVIVAKTSPKENPTLTSRQ